MRPGQGVRVAMVCGPATPDRDGVSDYVQHLVAVLAGVGVEAVPVPVCPVGTAGGGARATSRWLAATRRAADAVRRLRPDLVHVQFAPSAYRFSAVPGLLPLLLPPTPPLVTTVHEYGWWAAPSWVPEPVWRLAERARVWDRETGRLVPASVAVVVSNAQHGARLQARTGRSPTEVPLAPNVDDHPAAAGDGVRRRLGLAPDAPLLVFFGFVHPVKGVRYAIEALPSLRLTHPDLHLLVIGGFTSQALPEPEARAFRLELDDLAGRHGVARAVTFTGHLPAAEVSGALHACDAAVLPFTSGVTTKSGAVLATLAHGLPTAVTAADVPDPHLRDGDTVAVIPARRDSAAVARTVERLLADAALRRRLADGGRRLAARHSWQRVATAHRALYDGVLESRRG
jgi:glycosyltransferase involved in cell wall biosynthesis